MAEPVSTTVAAAVAAPAVAAAAPAASSAAPAAGSGAGAGGAGASGAGSNSPAFSLKSQGSPLDSVATQSNTGPDTSSMQRTLGCHDGSSTMPKGISPETPGEMPNIADHWFNGSGQHGQIHLPQIEQPGHQTLRQPDTLPGESVREPSAFDRAQSSSRPAETPDPVGPRPEQRATTNPELQSGTPQANGTPEARKSEPTAADFAQSAEPASPPQATQRPTEPTPADAATASEPSRVPDRTAEAAPPDAPAELPPMFGPEVEAFTLGGISGFFGIFVEGLADFGDLMFDTFAMHGDKPGARDDFEKARDEFRTFSEGTGRVAMDKDETFGAAGMVLGGIGPEAVSPGNKAKAVGAAGAAATAVGAYAKKKVKQKLAKKAKKVVPKPKPGKSAPDFELFEQAARHPGLENHHVALKAVFARADDPVIQGIYYELRSVPLSVKTHQTLHRIVNNALRRADLMPGSKGAGTKAAFNNQEVEQSLQVLADTYRREGVEDFAQHVEGMMNAMRDAGLF